MSGSGDEPDPDVIKNAKKKNQLLTILRCHFRQRRWQRMVSVGNHAGRCGGGCLYAGEKALAGPERVSGAGN